MTNAVSSKTVADPQPDQNDQQPAKQKYSVSTIFLWVVIVVLSATQGMTVTADTLYKYIYKNGFHLQPSTVSKLSSLVVLPWSMKPIWGAITDGFPIFGYKRKPYIVLTASLVFVGFFMYYLGLPSVPVGIGLIVLIHFGQSFQSVVGQAIIVENTQASADGEDRTAEEKAEAAAKGVSVYFGGRLVGRFLSGLALSFVITDDNYRELMLPFSFVPISILVISFLLKEKRIKKNDGALLHNAPDVEVDGPRPRSATKTDKMKQFWTFMKHPLIFRAWLFVFFTGFQVSAEPVSFYYYTNFLGFSAKQVSALSTISTAALILGILLYYFFFKKAPLKSFYSVTFFIIMATQLVMLVLYFRLNVAWGIPDFAMIVLDNFIQNMVAELNIIPIWALTAKLCPKGMEATVYASMLAGTNFAGIASGQIGGYIVDWLYITDKNFDNIWILAIIGALTPLISLYFVLTVNFDDAIKFAAAHNADEVMPENTKGSFLSNGTHDYPKGHEIPEEESTYVAPDTSREQK